MAQINSSQITFVDITDSRKLDVYISSNLPTTQIYNSNTGAYSPDWSTTNLQLTADVYLDSKKITPESIKWYKKATTSEEWQMDGTTFTIKTNVLSNNPIATYICRVTYQGIQAFNEITFMRADTGLNGSNGADGTSVTILGSYKTISELQAAHPTGNAGDAYIVDGDLYVWAIDDAQWENVGNIQGPAGADGKDAKSIVLSGDSQVFKVSKSNVISPSTITVTAKAFNTTVTNWTYSTNGGQTFLSTVPSGVSRNGSIVTITGSSIASNSIVIKASDGEIEDVFTVYKAVDGVDGSKGNDGAPAPIAFLTNENVTFSANAQGQITGTTITSSVVAYRGTTKVSPTIGTITGVPTGMTITSSTVAASNEIMLTITIANNSTLGSTTSNMGVISIPITNPASTVLYLTWSKVNTGATGTNASLVDITPSAYYFKSTNGKDGTFTPEYIYVYPRFQNVTFSKWEYSVDGGVTWVAASSANGLTIGTYSSVANTLRIARTSTLYTDTVTSISFRCVSSNTAIYDTISIAKLFDVDVEEINTMITDGFAEVKTTTDSIISKANATEQTVATINGDLSSLTTRVSNAEQKITPTAIVSTVRQSTDYVNDLGKKVGNTEIISKINQTAESITISANKIGLLGATNIPDLTADKIKGGTLTLGGSSATTQNGQLLVKNASNVDVLKVNKDGIIAKSGHLAVARDFSNSTHNWEDDTWTTTTNTSQLDLGDNYIRMGVYDPVGYYGPYMKLTDENLSFQGNAQGVGNWGSFIGHDNLGYFVIQDTVRSNISFRDANDREMANLNSNSFDINVPAVFNGGISYISIVANTDLNNMKMPGFYKCALSATAKTLGHCPTANAFSLVIEAHAGVKQTLTVYLTTNKPIIYVRNFYNNTWGEWSRLSYAGESMTLWTGAILSNTTITVSENIHNFKFLTCMMGDASLTWGITMGAFMDSDVSELHFGAIYTDANSIAGANLYGVRFNINSDTSLTMQACGTKSGGGAYMRKIVGWR